MIESLRRAAPPALTHPPYRTFWLGLVLSSLGSQFTTVAMAWQIYELTDSPFQVGLLGLARAIPQMSMLLLGGLLADAVDRRRMLLGLQLAQCGISVSLGVLSATGLVTPLALYVATAALALCTALENPARQSMVPNLVPRSILTSALALNSTQRTLGTIVGPSLAGLLLAFSNPAWCYAVDAISWFAMLTAVWLVVPRMEKRVARGTISLEALRAGFSFVWHHQVIATLLALDLVANLCGTPRALLPVYARDVLDVGPTGLGFLYAAGAIGSLVVAVGLSIFGQVRRAGVCVLGGIAVFGVGTLLFSISTNFWLSALLLAIAGAGDTFSAVVRGTINQLSVPDELRGRVLSVNTLFTSGGPQLGQFRSGIAAETWGPVAAGVSGGVVVLMACAVALGLRRVRAYELHRNQAISA
jgi:MFS family permease